MKSTIENDTLVLVLNFFRYGIYVLADGIIEGSFLENPVYVITFLDIFQFAAFALIATGVLSELSIQSAAICWRLSFRIR